MDWRLTLIYSFPNVEFNLKHQQIYWRHISFKLFKSLYEYNIQQWAIRIIVKYWRYIRRQRYYYHCAILDANICGDLS